MCGISSVLATSVCTAALVELRKGDRECRRAALARSARRMSAACSRPSPSPVRRSGRSPSRQARWPAPRPAAMRPANSRAPPLRPIPTGSRDPRGTSSARSALDRPNRYSQPSARAGPPSKHVSSELRTGGSKLATAARSISPETSGGAQGRRSTRTGARRPTLARRRGVMAELVTREQESRPRRSWTARAKTPRMCSEDRLGLIALNAASTSSAVAALRGDAGLLREPLALEEVAREDGRAASSPAAIAVSSVPRAQLGFAAGPRRCNAR